MPDAQLPGDGSQADPLGGGQNAHGGAQTAQIADFRAWRHDTNYLTMTASTTRTTATRAAPINPIVGQLPRKIAIAQLTIAVGYQ